MKNKIFTTLLGLIIGIPTFSQTWILQNAGSGGAGQTSMHVYDVNSVWACANTATGGVFTKTSNGGTSWTPGVFNIGNNAKLYSIASISGVSATTAWVMSPNGSTGPTSTSTLGEVWKTTNGGTNWIKQFTLPSIGIAVHFFDANNGWVIGSQASTYDMYTTQNGGDSWSQVPLGNISGPMTGIFGYHQYYVVNGVMFLCFYNINNGITDYKIYKSTDKGVHWSPVSGSFQGGQFNDFLMAWSDANKGVVFLQTGQASGAQTDLKIYRTDNGGVTWSEVPFSGLSVVNRIYDIAYVPGKNTLIATSPNDLARGSWISTDNGTNWTAIDPGVSHWNVNCFGNSCYSAGWTSAAQFAAMYKMTFRELGTQEIKLNWGGIYPNPTKGELYIKTDKKIKSSTVLDGSGRIVLMADSSDKLDLSSFPKGVYVVNIEFGDGTSSSEKVIKE
ncbi:T9SS type A sorting domain-containing protein [Chryseobacterium indologenes]|uniref:Secretion system C-terminal sorting domain-containing protein n=1 Tax=Chryseobacterium indologenes TaxID=253 RepID=A0A0N0IUW9_CHRID|nr:T9SS type A sorting domain-containing protein [Chryseobacterium indologenes]KPE50011.1 hypothetical protein AOB46_16235 [Chryseobacterium indologenes]